MGDGTHTPAHSLPDSSDRLVKFVESIVESQPGILGPVLGGDPAVPLSAEEMRKAVFQDSSPVGKMNFLSSGAWCREGHVHCSKGLGISLHVSDAKKSGNIISIDLSDVGGGQSCAGQQLPHRFRQVEAERGTGSDGDAHQDAKEPEHLHLSRALQGGIEEEAIPRGASLVPAVGRLDQKRHLAAHQLVAHLCDGLAVTSSTVIDRLTDELDLPGPVRQEEALVGERSHLGNHLTKDTFASVSVTGRSLSASSSSTSTTVVFASLAFGVEPVQLNYGSMLSISDHCGLHHLAEGGLLGGGDQQGAQLVHAGWLGAALCAWTEPKREHGKTRAEHITEMVEKHKSVAQNCWLEFFEEVVLQRDRCWKS